MMNEERRCPRYALNLDVTMHPTGGGEPVRGRSQDISRTGIFVRCGKNFEVDQRVDLLIRDGEELLVLSGTVVHVIRGMGVGIEFSAINPRNQVRLERLIEVAGSFRQQQASG